VPNPYIRDPKRWLVLGALVVGIVAVTLIGDLIWPDNGPWMREFVKLLKATAH